MSGAEPQRELAAVRIRLDRDDPLEPAGAQADERHRADRPAAEHADGSARRRAGDVDPVQRDRERLDQRAVGELDPVGEPPEHLGGADHPLGVAAVVRPEPDAARHRGDHVELVERRERIDADAVARRPAVDAGADLGDDAGELVAHHRALRERPGRQHVEIGAADPAGLDLDDHLPVAGSRIGDVANLERLLRAHGYGLQANSSGMRSGQPISASSWAARDSRRSSRLGGTISWAGERQPARRVRRQRDRGSRLAGVVPGDRARVGARDPHQRPQRALCRPSARPREAGCRPPA